MGMLADPQPLADGLAALRAWLAREFSSPSIIAQTAAIAAAGVWRCSSHRGWRD